MRLKKLQQYGYNSALLRQVQWPFTSKVRKTVPWLSPTITTLILAACGGGGKGAVEVSSIAPSVTNEGANEDDNTQNDPLTFNSANSDEPVIVPVAQGFNTGQTLYSPHVVGGTNANNLRYSKSGIDENSFEINVITGALRFVDSVDLNPDNEGAKDNYFVTIIVIDDKGTATTEDDEIAHQELTISIDASSSVAPLVMSLSDNDHYIAEGNYDNGLKLATISFTGGLPSASRDIKLHGTDLDLFEIKNSNELWLRQGVVLDYEQRADRVLAIELVSEHNANVKEHFTLFVENIDEHLTFDVPTGQYVVEDEADNYVLGILEAHDPEGDPITYQLLDVTSQNNVFSGEYGELELNPITGAYSYYLDNRNERINKLNVGDALVENFTIMASDSKGQTISKSLSFDIHGVNDAPTDILLSNNLISEAQDTLVIGVLSTIDPDQPSDEKFNYSFDLPKFETGYRSDFAINSNTGELSVISQSALDYLVSDFSVNSFNFDDHLEVHIIVTDSGGESFTKSFRLYTVLENGDYPLGMPNEMGIDNSAPLSQTGFDVI